MDSQTGLQFYIQNACMVFLARNQSTYYKQLLLAFCPLEPCVCGAFLGDMWPNKDEDEPEWVKGERTQFSSYRDTNGDGFMDHEEVKNWIIPPNYDHSEAEAKHLIYEADENKVR